MYGWTKQIAVHEMSMINTPDEQMNDLRATTHTHCAQQNAFCLVDRIS